MLSDDTAAHSLGRVLGVGQLQPEALYRALDWLHAAQPGIEKRLARQHLAGTTLVLYDLTSTWLTGRCCPLAARGHSRDGKRDDPQIVLGLICSAAGCPVAVEVFPGNCADPTTVAAQVVKLKDRFGIEQIAWVGDRGMITSARINNVLRPHGMDWISSLRAAQIALLAHERGPFQPSLFDERNLLEIASEHFPNERLIVCRNPLLAEERSRKRSELLAATEAELQTIVTAIERTRRPVRGAQEIALRVGRSIDRYRMAKHFELTITQAQLSWVRKQDPDRRRSSPGWLVCCSYQPPREIAQCERRRGRLQESVSGRACLPLDQDRRLTGASGVPLQRRARSRACLLVHARLLRRVDDAGALEADAVR